MTTSVTHSPSGLTLPVPSGWQPSPGAGAPVVLASLLNMVATVEQLPLAMTDVAAYTDASIDGMRRMLTGFHVIAVDAVTIGAYEGRRALCGYRSGMYALATEYWWTVPHGVATTLIASCQVEDYLDLAQVFEDVAAGMIPATRVPQVGVTR
jgi:hypothetical protein